MDDRIRARRDAVRRGAQRRRRRRVGSLLLVAGLLAAVVTVTYSPLFAVTEVRVSGVGTAAAAEVRAATGVIVGERLLSVDLDAAEARVESLPWVRSATADRLPPSVVEVAVQAREPVAVLETPLGRWLLDGEAVVVAGGDRTGLPVVEAPQAVVPALGREVSDSAVQNAVAVHITLPGPLRATVDRYEAHSDRGLRLRLDAGGVGRGGAPPDAGKVWVRFGLAERVEAKARVIGLLLDQARGQPDSGGGRDGLGIAELDVRAPDNPVVVPER